MHSRFSPDIQVDILLIVSFREGDDDQKIFRFDSCFTNFCIFGITQRRKILFWEKFVICNVLLTTQWFTLF